MIYILFTWIYITAINYSIGSFIHSVISRSNEPKNQPIANFSLVCISGMLTTVFISTILCLFMPLAAFANCILLLFAILSVLFNRKDLRKQLKITKSGLINTPIVFWILFLIFLAVFGYISFQPSSHHDDGLYYSTSIKWLQEYGTVRGLVNLNPRIGYNSSWLILQALYGFAYLKKGLFNDLNGLLFLYVLIFAMGGIIKLIRGDRSLSVLMRAIFILPAIAFYRGRGSDWMMFNFNFIESCTADLPVCLLIWIVFILFLESASDPSKKSLVAFYSLLTITIKLSAMPLLLLPLFFAVRPGNIKRIFYSAAMGLLLLSPWIIRNVLLSGYLLYPFPGLDLFHLSWKIPNQFVKFQESAIMVMAADPTQSYGRPFAESVLQWFPKWFSRQTIFQKTFFLGTITATLAFVVMGITMMIRQGIGFFSKYLFHIILAATGVCGISLWLLKGPDFRFGYGFMSIYCIFFLAILLNYFLKKKLQIVGWFSAVFIGAIGLFYYARELIVVNKILLKPPIPYRMPEEMSEVHFPDGTIVYIVKHDDSWNAPLPVANENEFKELNPSKIGVSIQEGFYCGRSRP